MPTDPSVVDIGIGASVALLIIKEVLSFVRDTMHRKSGNGNGYANVPPAMMAGIKELTRDYFSPVLKMTTDLYNWHNVHDSDGVKLWYVRRSLVNAIDRLSSNIEAQTRYLSELSDLQQRTVKLLIEERDRHDT